jgi:hypothetical protein
MLTAKQFKKRLSRDNSPDWLHVAMDARDKTQFYIVGYGGMGTSISMPIERFSAEIRVCVIDMLGAGELVMDEKRSLLLEINILVHYLSLSTTHKEEI